MNQARTEPSKGTIRLGGYSAYLSGGSRTDMELLAKSDDGKLIWQGFVSSGIVRGDVEGTFTVNGKVLEITWDTGVTEKFAMVKDGKFRDDRLNADYTFGNYWY